MTETGANEGSDTAGHRPAREHAVSRDEASVSSPVSPDASHSGIQDELPRWQPFADMAAVPSSAEPPATLVPTAVEPPQAPPSEWIIAPPEAEPRRGVPGGRVLRVLGSVVGVLVVGSLVAGLLGFLPSDKGKILFGTAPGKDLCSVSGRTDTATTTDPIFFAAVLKHHLDGQQSITFHITRDGEDFVSHEEPADGSAFDCYGSRESLGTLDTGSYVFEVIHNGEIEATGTLTVK